MSHIAAFCLSRCLSICLNFIDIEASYRAKEDFVDGVANIFNCLGAKALQDYAKAKDKKREEFSSQLVKYLKKTDEYSKMNEYSWLIKGFFEIKQGAYLTWS